MQIALVPHNLPTTNPPFIDMEPMDYELLIGCEVDDDGNLETTLIAANEDSAGDFLLGPGDTLVFSLLVDDTLEGEADPGSYAVVAIPQDDIVAPEDQFFRIEPGENRSVTIIEDPLKDDEEAEEEEFVLILMIFTENCGCLYAKSGDDFRVGPDPVPVIKRKKKKRK